jgi:predicted RecA/RadA family phage recombinase
LDKGAADGVDFGTTFASADRKISVAAVEVAAKTSIGYLPKAKAQQLKVGQELESGAAGAQPAISIDSTTRIDRAINSLLNFITVLSSQDLS